MKIKALGTVVVTLLFSATCAQGALVTGWTGGGRPSDNGLQPGTETTASPVVGNGTANNADDESIDAAFPAVTLGASGDKVTLSGFVTTAGTVAGAGQFRFGLFRDDAAGDANAGWVGYFSNNSNGTTNQPISLKPVGNTALHISGTGAVALAPQSRSTGDVTFTDGTYAFSLTIERSGDDLLVSSTLTNSATGYNHVLAVTDAGAATDGTSTTTYDRVAFLSLGGGADADQVSFSNIDVTFTPIPEPATAGLVAIAATALALRRRRR